MDYQATFKRYEVKSMLTRAQKYAMQETMRPYMELDKYGRTTIRNIYFDTENYRLIRHSLESPTYKEKLRLRSYRKAGPEDPAFVELKKKYKSVVYKRRLEMPAGDATLCLLHSIALPIHSQIANEIEYFRNYYGDLRPAMFISYEREAYYSDDGSDFRVTFDENILCRQSDFSLASDAYGLSILPEGMTLMEIKTSGGYPLWMSHELNRLGIFKTSFSKYGTAYRRMFEEHNLSQTQPVNTIQVTTGGRLYA